ncbi:hypothetical protein OG345_42310 (plasmid) [Streptomyces sp. NBC_01220]|uniref:hypothetical protein n=1 Tax=Streptomyces sp. NBC_01220 TaxID=2903781 RepID=UPI00352D2839|nr:hypothetical protein OG345_42310 [Streptomyces sp. NBC_01220]
MSTTLAPAADSSTRDLEQRVELIACGTRAGKTRACDRHRGKGRGFVNIASTGAVDALAAAICGTGRSPACRDCKGKALEIMRVYNEGAA